MRRHRATFVDELRRGGRQLPAVVAHELDIFLACGVPAHGVARVRCGACGHELLVAFSCKRRGICQSCTARRAEDTAAHLVDHVLPRVPYRQSVFTFPIAVRLALSRRPHLLTAALRACLRVLFAFGSALQLNVHFHVLAPDGGFDEHGVFVVAEPPTDEDSMVCLRGSPRSTDFAQYGTPSSA